MICELDMIPRIGNRCGTLRSFSHCLLGTYIDVGHNEFLLVPPHRINGGSLLNCHVSLTVPLKLVLSAVVAFSLFTIPQLASTSLAQKPPQATDAKKIKLLAGFQAELVYSVPRNQGSWVSLTSDAKGRLIASDQHGKLYRITPGGESAKVEPIALQIGHAHGLLCAFDSLYVVSHKNGRMPAGLYRVTDSNDDDQYDAVQLLRQFEGGGEHGPHSIVLSPDKKSLYVCGGNHTKIPKPETSRVPRRWAEDQLLPRMWDAGGHAVGILAPGGWIAKTDPDGKYFELFSIGYRNQFDIAFDPRGELFTFDADMEWDIGTPWYRPTRICHVTSGSEFGWRSGTGKWPEYYPDSLPATVDIGPGSPTGIAFGTGTKFPTKYQKALFASDWSYGVVYAVHLEPNQATYKATFEPFFSAPALQVADLIVHQDGSLYFVIGGRGTQSGLYRITYHGDESVDAPEAEPFDEVAQLRRKLDSMHLRRDAKVVDEAWPHLGHADRFVRFAARVAIEHQPVERWADKVFEAKDPQIILESALALCRCGNRRHEARLMATLAQLDWSTMTRDQQLHLIRVYGLAWTRMQAPRTTRAQVKKLLDPVFPSADPKVNRELARLLVAVDAPKTVDRIFTLIDSASTQEEKIHYILCLRSARQWTLNLRRRYFQWFLDAAALNGGRSFNGFLKNIRQEVINGLSRSERRGLRDILAKQPVPVDPLAELKARPLVQKWTMDALNDVVENQLQGRDFDNGKKMFSVAQCFKCHRFDGEGGIVGPDLTAAGRRFNKRDLLQSLLEPSAVQSDQYQATKFLLLDGRTITGRVVNLNGDSYTVQTDMMVPNKLTTVKVGDIDEMTPSKVSMMPDGLLDTLSQEEVLDLLAYLRSGGKRDSDEIKQE